MQLDSFPKQVRHDEAHISQDSVKLFLKYPLIQLDTQVPLVNNSPIIHVVQFEAEPMQVTHGDWHI